jgi:hypothetical protein
MTARLHLISSLAVAGLFARSAGAGPLVYVTAVNYNTSTGEFGTTDPTTGTFNQIGAGMPDPLSGLVPGPNGTLLSMSFSGNLDSINPVTGAVTVIGATGLGNLAAFIAALNGTVYTTDLESNLYTVNTTTGAVTLIGNTGIPPCPSLTDPDEVSDLSMFTYGGNLYETFDGINLVTMALVDSPELYQINTTTGVATLVDPTAFGLGAAAWVNGTLYAFDSAASNTVVSLNPVNGNTAFVTNDDMNGFDVIGATATPEPASFALACGGIATIVLLRRRRRPTRRSAVGR